ncbi:MAG TPA: prepilin peptidase [Kofleriaceae bacterium]|nr:prepilin peptidase [Kofleriaceae bacterium]
MIASSAATVNMTDPRLEALAMGPWGYVFATVMGLLWGSFANVCIYRWPPTDEFPKGRSVVTPGSHCGVCKTPVKWYDNIPLLSYFILRGRCRQCGTSFSPRYLMVEALTGALFALAWWVIIVERAPIEALDQRLVRFAIIAGFSVVMVVITFIDLDHKLILDKLTYPAIPAFYLLGWLALPERGWKQGLIGAALGYGIIRAVSDGYYYLTKREGLGYGDGKLLAIVGALCGWRGVLFTLFAGSITGSILGIAAVIAARRDGGEDEEEVEEAEGDEGEADDISIRHVELPFGPYLAAAAMFYVLAEPWLRVKVWFLAG